MRNRFETQLEKLNYELVEMGNLVQKSIQGAVSGLVNKDLTIAEETIEFDAEIDRQEKEIESLCMKLLLQQQPVASDLRLISSALKMITDMERIGDQAADISEITIFLAEAPYIKQLDDIPKMANEATLMVVQSIEAFVNKDLLLAEKVIKHDDIVDEYFAKIKMELIDLIREDVNNSEQATDLLMIAKYLERIGDHATNIAEWVIFAITGRH